MPHPPTAYTSGTVIVFNSKFSESSDEFTATLAHEATHVLQNERADQMGYSLLGIGGFFGPDGRPSWEGELRREKEAYTYQGIVEQDLHLKGEIYDPSDLRPGADARRANRIDSAGRGSASITCPSVAYAAGTEAYKACQP